MNNVLEKGDLIFRSGNPAFQKFLGSPYTHCAIYIGHDTVHDLYNTGLRTVSLEQFVDESSDKSHIEVFRPKLKYFSNDIIDKLIDRIEKNKTIIPDSEKPWNVFSAWGDYDNSGCIKYCLYNYFDFLKQKLEFQATYVPVQLKTVNTFVKMSARKRSYSETFNNHFETKYYADNKYPVALHSSLLNCKYFEYYSYKL